MDRIEELRSNPTTYTIRDNWRRIHLSNPRLELHRYDDRLEYILDKNFDGREFISIPTNEDARLHARRVVSMAQGCDNSLFQDCQIRECRVDSLNNPYDALYIDIMFVSIESGRLLSECTASESLYLAVELLESTLQQFDIYFENLSPENVIVGIDGRLYPFLYNNIRFCRGDYSADCDSLRSWLSLASGIGECEVIDYMDPYPIRDIASIKYLFQGFPRCDRSVVKCYNKRWGYINSAGDMVVEAQYAMAYGFVDGYAVVVSRKGWGLIDIDGVETIPSTYEDLAYNGGEICSAKRGDRWAYFSCSGAQLTPFVIDYPDESITRKEVAALDCAYSLSTLNHP
ncbi:MAG: WG repeat-containing protein [Rikenellaceae bacterium]